MAKTHKKGEFMYCLKMANRYRKMILNCNQDEGAYMLRLRDKMRKWVERAKDVQPPS